MFIKCAELATLMQFGARAESKHASRLRASVLHMLPALLLREEGKATCWRSHRVALAVRFALLFRAALLSRLEFAAHAQLKLRAINLLNAAQTAALVASMRVACLFAKSNLRVCRSVRREYFCTPLVSAAARHF